MTIDDKNDELVSNPNDENKKKQKLLVFAGVGVFIAGMAGSLLFFDSSAEEVEEGQTVETVELKAPGTVEEADQLANTVATDVQQNTDKVSQLEQQLAERDEYITSLNDKIERALSNAEQAIREAEAAKAEARERPTIISSPASSPAPVLNPPPVVITETSPETGKTLPQGLNGNKILGDPNAPTPPINRDGGNAIEQKPQVKIINVKNADGQDRVSISRKETFIPEGSFVRVIMVNGADAPTSGQAQSDPLPVLFETVGNLNMPNNYKLDIKGCRFLGYAWGNLSSERVMARIESGSCIINGQAVKIDLKGHIIGEDGKTGMRGKVVSKQGQALAAAALSSAFEAIGGLYSNTVGTTTTGALGVQRTVSGSQVGKSAAGAAIGGGADKLSEFYLRRAEELFPVVEVHAGRAVEILITKGATIADLNFMRKSGSNRIKLKDD